MAWSNALFILITITCVNLCKPLSSPALKNSFLGMESEKITFSNEQVEEAFLSLEKVKGHSLGKKILDTIAIQLKSDVPLKEISKLLSDLADELERQQHEVDKARGVFEDSCSNDIGKYDERIQSSNQNINEIDSIIIKLKSNLVTLNSTIKNRDFQIELLERKEKDILDLRRRDEADFERRRKQSGEILTAISLIIPKLENLGSKRELQDALLQLSSIGSTNPINSLVFLSSTFENSALETIKEKLQKLKKSIEASIIDDEQYDAEASIAVKNLLDEIKMTKKEVEAERASEEANQRDAERNLKLQLNRREESLIESKTAENGRNQRVAQCSEYFNNYKIETAHRLEEIEIVLGVQNLLASKMEIFKKYINENS